MERADLQLSMNQELALKLFDRILALACFAFIAAGVIWLLKK